MGGPPGPCNFAPEPIPKASTGPGTARLRRSPWLPPCTASDDAKPVLLALLTHPATATALAEVRTAVRSTDPRVSDAAIRALGDWPTADPADDLYRIAAQTSSPSHRRLALNGEGNAGANR